MLYFFVFLFKWEEKEFLLVIYFNSAAGDREEDTDWGS